MSQEEKNQAQKKTSLKLSSASFKPKSFKPKTNISASKSPETQTTTPEHPSSMNPNGFGALPPPLPIKTGDKPGGVLPFPSLLGSTPPIDMSGMMPFPNGPMKPPPLLFSQPDDILQTNLGDNKNEKAQSNNSSVYQMQ